MLQLDQPGEWLVRFEVGEDGFGEPLDQPLANFNTFPPQRLGLFFGVPSAEVEAQLALFPHDAMAGAFRCVLVVSQIFAHPPRGGPKPQGVGQLAVGGDATGGNLIQEAF